MILSPFIYHIFPNPFLLQIQIIKNITKIISLFYKESIFLTIFKTFIYLAMNLFTEVYALLLLMKENKIS